MQDGHSVTLQAKLYSALARANLTNVEQALLEIILGNKAIPRCKEDGGCEDLKTCRRPERKRCKGCSYHTCLSLQRYLSCGKNPRLTYDGKGHRYEQPNSYRKKKRVGGKYYPDGDVVKFARNWGEWSMNWGNKKFSSKEFELLTAEEKEEFNAVDGFNRHLVRLKNDPKERWWY